MHFFKLEIQNDAHRYEQWLGFKFYQYNRSFHHRGNKEKIKKGSDRSSSRNYNIYKRLVAWIPPSLHGLDGVLATGKNLPENS
mgnify:CR=1 FL=1